MASNLDTEQRDLTTARAVLVVGILALIALVLDHFTGLLTRLVAQLPDWATKVNFVLAPVLTGVALLRRSAAWVRSTVGSHVFTALVAAFAVSLVIPAASVRREGYAAIVSMRCRSGSPRPRAPRRAAR